MLTSCLVLLTVKHSAKDSLLCLFANNFRFPLSLFCFDLDFDLDEAIRPILIMTTTIWSDNIVALTNIGRRGGEMLPQNRCSISAPENSAKTCSLVYLFLHHFTVPPFGELPKVSLPEQTKYRLDNKHFTFMIAQQRTRTTYTK